MVTEDFDLKELQKCVYCDRGMMHSNSIFFYEVKTSQCVVDLKSVQQLDGLERMMGAASSLAAIFAPSTRVAHRMPSTTKLVCSDCMHRIHELIGGD